MKPNHKTFKDFPNLYSATKYLDELKVKVLDMQRKYDVAKDKHPPYKVSPEWFRRLTVALKHHKIELENLQKQIGAAEKQESIRQENFYKTFYECAKLNLARNTFDLLCKAAREANIRNTNGSKVGIASFNNPDFQGNNQVNGKQMPIAIVDDALPDAVVAFTGNQKDWSFAILNTK